MTKITGMKASRLFENTKDGIKKRDDKVTAVPRMKYNLTCGTDTFEIPLSPGQAINTKKMCKKLLKLKNNDEKNKRGYQGKKRN